MAKAKVDPAAGKAAADRAESLPSTGRPTKYVPAYCDELIAFMSEGYSLTAFAGQIGVSRATLNLWMAANPEFMEAVSRGKAARLLQWEKIGMNVAKEGGGPGSSTMIVFGLKNMGGDEWSAPEKLEHVGKDGGPIETRELSADEVRERLKERGLPTSIFDK